MHNLKKELGNKIRGLRKLKDLTQEQLGEKSGLSYKFIGEIERGEVNPSLDSLKAIASALGVNARDLFPGESDFVLNFTPSDLQLLKKAIRLLHIHLSMKK
jgi:transcriptional regulator with XRE-family HTH domain